MSRIRALMFLVVVACVAAACVAPPGGSGGGSSRPWLKVTIESIDGFLGQSGVVVRLETSPTAVRFRLSNGQNVSEASWRELVETLDWDLGAAGADGPRTVSAQAVDSFGVESEVVKVNLVLDRTSPELTFTSHGPSSTVEGASGALVEFSGEVSDGGAGVDFVRFGQVEVPVEQWALAEVRGGSWSGFAEAVGASGPQTLGVEAVDRVGNVARIDRPLQVNATPPGAPIPRLTTLEVTGSLYDALVLIGGQQRLEFLGDRRSAFAGKQSVFGLPREPIAPEGFLRQIESVAYDPSTGLTTVTTSQGDVLAAIARFSVADPPAPAGLRAPASEPNMDDCQGLEDVTLAQSGSDPTPHSYARIIDVDAGLFGPNVEFTGGFKIGLAVAAGVSITPPGWAGSVAVLTAFTVSPVAGILELATHSRYWAITASVGVCVDAEIQRAFQAEWESPAASLRFPGPPAGPVPTSFALSGSLFIRAKLNAEGVSGVGWGVANHWSTKDDLRGGESTKSDFEIPTQPQVGNFVVTAGEKAKLSWQVLDVKFGIGSEFLEGEVSANLIGYPNDPADTADDGYAGIWGCPNQDLSFTPGLSLFAGNSYTLGARVTLLQLFDVNETPPDQSKLQELCEKLWSDANPPAPTTTTTTLPPAQAMSGATQITANGAHTCAVVAGGAVKCWGSNLYGALGDGTNNNSFVPVGVVGVSGATQISAGGAHTCAVVSGGAVKCWGENLWGALGDGTNNDSFVPVGVVGVSGATQITSSGYGHTCALVSGGAVKCWGYNGYGGLGDGTNNNSNVPVGVVGVSGATQISAGGGYTCAVVAGGAVKCWGENYDGQLGNGTTDNSFVPVGVVGVSGATHITASGSHTCAIVSGGAVKCWGENYDGQLGNGTTDNSFVPVGVVAVSGATQISAGTGNSQTCAVVSGGAVKCWGWGNGSSGPVAVSGITGATQISVGGPACAVVSGGAVKCWGYNHYGGLGDGTNNNSFVPVDVLSGA
jgi:alpha-tubulin suppressor-like RCC1 family protein